MLDTLAVQIHLDGSSECLENVYAVAFVASFVFAAVMAWYGREEGWKGPRDIAPAKLRTRRARTGGNGSG